MLITRLRLRDFRTSVEGRNGNSADTITLVP
jgi:hypothetical protein